MTPLAGAPVTRRRTAWRCLGLALATSVLLAGCAGDDTIGPSPTPTPERMLAPPFGGTAPAAGHSSITEQELRELIEYLASPALAGRGSGQGGDELAARTIANEMAASGLAPEGGEAGLMQRFTVSGRGDAFNVVGYFPGTVPAYADTPLVVGAHYDHLGATASTYYPGADDNASGTAVVVEVAEAFKAAGAAPRRPVIFAAFGGEELGLLGSRLWVSNRYPYGSGALPLFMINADMVGHVRTGQLRLLGVSASEPLADGLRTICERNGVPDPVFYPSAGGGSDHVPFQGIGVPVVFFHTGTHADYHTPRDLPATLDFAGITVTARIVYELAWNMANAKAMPRFSVPRSPAPEAWEADHGLLPFAAPRLLR
jgi:hypothetical protein